MVGERRPFHLKFVVKVTHPLWKLPRRSISAYNSGAIWQKFLKHRMIYMVHYHSDYITRGNKYKLSNHRFHYDLQSTIFLHVLLIFGIVYLTMLSNVNVNTVNPFKTCYLSTISLPTWPELVWYIVLYLLELLFRHGHWGVTTCIRWSSLSWVELQRLNHS